VFDFAALDVALGLIFVFLVLSLVCSAINETVSSVLAWRADTLRDGIENMLGNKQARESLYRHPLVAGLIRQKGSWLSRQQRLKKLPLVRKLPAVNDERYPSYLPANVVVNALLFPAVGSKPLTTEEVEKAIESLPDGPVQKSAEVLWSEASRDVARFRQNMETWYDEVMSRVSGWYRRRVQFWLWVWAILLVLVVHADTLDIAQTLWTDEARRDAVVARAEAVATGQDDPNSYINQLNQLEIPLGWGSWPTDDPWYWVILTNALGLALTAVALTMGAPFWFDLLKKVANVRAAGKAPEEKPVEKAAEAGEPSAPARGG
jgi:hypothetical protein